MHIIAFLTALAGLVWALHSLQQSGLDLNALNPFLWHRRRQWLKKHGTHPLYGINEPMLVAAVLLLATVKVDGEVSRDEKQALLDIFQGEFHCDQRRAAELLQSCSWLLKDDWQIRGRVPQILEASLPRWDDAQRQSMSGLLDRVAAIEVAAAGEKQALIDEIRQALQVAPATTWG